MYALRSPQGHGRRGVGLLARDIFMTSFFVHGEEHAGVSAFVNRPTEDAQRHAVMLAVGVLVPCTGRLGKCWKYVARLQQLAR